MSRRSLDDCGYLCRLGAFRSAIRMLARGRDRYYITAKLAQKYPGGNERVYLEIYDIARKSRWAAEWLRGHAPDEIIPQTELPRIPR